MKGSFKALLHFSFVYTKLQYLSKEKKFIQKFLIKELHCIQSFIEVPAVINCFQLAICIILFLVICIQSIHLVPFIDYLKSDILIHIR